MSIRDVPWDGFYNARDLGGLPTTDGGTTALGAFVRSGAVQFVPARGWRAAREAGFTTVLDLREPDEVQRAAAGSDPGAEGIVWQHLPLDDQADLVFWEPFTADGRWGTPLYYPDFLRAKGDRVAAAVTELAQAPGGVIFHCGAGRDRTGLLAALLLRLADVEPDAIAEDFELSTEGSRLLFERLGRPDQGPAVAATLAAHGTTARQAVLAAVQDLDVPAYLVQAGVTAPDVDRLRARLRG